MSRCVYIALSYRRAMFSCQSVVVIVMATVCCHDIDVFRLATDCVIVGWISVTANHRAPERRTQTKEGKNFLQKIRVSQIASP
ncbi:hypothetical protein EB796_019655 [Bugula neritina]|uniref:Uncharacterized protein n=1 Tax=Bugula neritina TaxID=10212 RepID=A0A7J7J8H4_BUGNE|nr:hypothetical protein EB796_019655 [Bugula neritina]